MLRRSFNHRGPARGAARFASVRRRRDDVPADQRPSPTRSTSGRRTAAARTATFPPDMSRLAMTGV